MSVCILSRKAQIHLPSAQHIVKWSMLGIHVVTLPGDGDVTLRSLQWGFYTCQRYNWFTELIVPLDLFYDSIGEYPIFGLQDPLHVLKKLRNNVKRL